MICDVASGYRTAAAHGIFGTFVGRRPQRDVPVHHHKGGTAMATFKIDIPAGPLWNNNEAQNLGPAIAAAHFGRFTGQWNTVVPSEMSVVQVELPAQPTGETEYTMDVPAGPLWSNDYAKEKCPSICASYGGTWNGQWTTVIAGKLSVASCTFRF
jgi:hypothetical protein